MMNFTTLFDSYYLDKALCMYHSLKNITYDFKLYIFCFDDKSLEVLKSENLDNVILLSHKDLEREYPELVNLKKTRSKAEYCWTCTPTTIEYVINCMHEKNCTYIDADIYFFSNPEILFDEIKNEDKHIIITPHRFGNSLKDRKLLKRSGKYCVEFNYFDNSLEATKALSWWKNKCFEWCFHIYEEDRMGDQKYLEKFPIMFKGVHELQNIGGGVAPWNLNQYTLNRNHKKNISLIERKTNEKFDLIFYHFQNIRYLSETKVNISSETNNKPLKQAIYLPYLREIIKIRKELKEKYNIGFSVKNIHASNKLIAFFQGTMLRYKIKSFTDIIDLKKI